MVSDPATPVAKRNVRVCSPKDTRKDSHSGLVHNSATLKTTQTPSMAEKVNESWYLHTVEYSTEMSTTSNMDESHKHKLR